MADIDDSFEVQKINSPGKKNAEKDPESKDDLLLLIIS